ncbi:MAG TPA: hypothetical protein VFG04_06105 [Planctomycetaceae bacterium]|jgi:hypothetical protein|nr:hypothetical protein [Planctomycetaceae bacterium]
MPDTVVELGKIDWKRVFPWVRLFRVFRTAIDLRMLSLSCVALVALSVGDSIFSNLPFAPSGKGAPESHAAYHWDRPAAENPIDFPAKFANHPWEVLSGIGTRWERLLQPVRTVLEPTRTILQPQATWSQKALAWTRLLWALCVWSVLAGAMTRIAAVEQATEAPMAFSSALRFSLENFLSYMTAALLPVAGIAVFWLLCAIGGWIGRIPFIGPPAIGLLWGLELVFGFLMALILIAAVAGWPLMYATIGAEASDGFDAFSRSYSYVFTRPWHYLWFSLVALTYGAFVTTFISIVASLVVYLSAAGVASGLGSPQTAAMLMGAPDSVGGPSFVGSVNSSQVGVGTLIAGAWLQVVGLLVAGFAGSFFWTSTTVIYLLLRHVDDATDFREVFPPPSEGKDELLPFVGVAASDQPVIERPGDGDFSAGPRRVPGLSDPNLKGIDPTLPSIQPPSPSGPTPPSNPPAANS